MNTVDREQVMAVFGQVASSEVVEIKAEVIKGSTRKIAQRGASRLTAPLELPLLCIGGTCLAVGWSTSLGVGSTRLLAGQEKRVVGWDGPARAGWCNHDQKCYNLRRVKD